MTCQKWADKDKAVCGTVGVIEKANEKKCLDEAPSTDASAKAPAKVGGRDFGDFGGSRISRDREIRRWGSADGTTTQIPHRQKLVLSRSQGESTLVVVQQESRPYQERESEL